MYCTKCGTYIDDNAIYCKYCGAKTTDANAQKQSSARSDRLSRYSDEEYLYALDVYKRISGGPSQFTGGAFSLFFRRLLVGFVSIITLGIAAAWINCWLLRWEAEHTYINGRQLEFVGTGAALFVNYLKWTLLTLVTLGLYLLITQGIAYERWRVANTRIAYSDKPSEFTGKAIGLLGVRFLTSLVTLVTFGFGGGWAHCYTLRWFCEHTVYGGVHIRFDGRALDIFLKTLLWSFLSLITLGIYGFWFLVNVKKWNASNTHLDPLDIEIDSMSDEDAAAVESALQMIMDKRREEIQKLAE